MRLYNTIRSHLFIVTSSKTYVRPWRCVCSADHIVWDLLFFICDFSPFVQLDALYIEALSFFCSGLPKLHSQDYNFIRVKQ